MKCLLGLCLTLVLAACAAPDASRVAEDHSRQCRQLAYETSLSGTPDEQGIYQICMRTQGYRLISGRR